MIKKFFLQFLTISTFTSISPVYSFLDHIFDFHLDLDQFNPDKGKDWNDLELTPEERRNCDRMKQRQSRDGNSRNDDNGGRDFTPDRDK